MFGTKQSAGHFWSTYVNRFSFTKWLNSSYALSWQPFPHSLRNQCLLVLYSYYGNGYYVFWIPFHTHYKVANSSLPFHPSHLPSLPLSLLQVHGLLEILLLSLLAIDIVLRLIWLRPRHFIQHKRTAFIVRGLHHLLAVYIAIDSWKIE